MTKETMLEWVKKEISLAPFSPNLSTTLWICRDKRQALEMGPLLCPPPMLVQSHTLFFLDRIRPLFPVMFSSTKWGPSVLDTTNALLVHMLSRTLCRGLFRLSRALQYRCFFLWQLAFRVTSTRRLLMMDVLYLVALHSAATQAQPTRTVFASTLSISRNLVTHSSFSASTDPMLMAF